MKFFYLSERKVGESVVVLYKDLIVAQHEKYLLIVAVDCAKSYEIAVD